MNNIRTALLVTLSVSGICHLQGREYLTWSPWAYTKASKNEIFGNDIEQYDHKEKQPYWIRKRIKDAPTDICRVIRMPHNEWEQRHKDYDQSVQLAKQLGVAGFTISLGSALAQKNNTKLAFVVGGIVTISIGLINMMMRFNHIEGRTKIQPEDNLAPQLDGDREKQHAHIALIGLMKEMKYTIEIPNVSASVSFCSCPINGHTAGCKQRTSMQQAAQTAVQGFGRVAQQLVPALAHPSTTSPVQKVDNDLAGEPILYEQQYTELTQR
jgi:hypothetical protein